MPKKSREEIIWQPFNSLTPSVPGAATLWQKASHIPVHFSCFPSRMFIILSLCNDLY